MLNLRFAAALGAGCAMGLSSAQGAILISGDVAASEEQTGANFSGTLDYLHNGGNSGTLTVTLTNTSPAGVGGFLTAFLFNFGTDDDGAGTSLTSSSRPAMTDAAGSNGSPFGGAYMGGAGTGGQFEGGGPAAGGVAIGSTGTFVFMITADDAGSLTDASFLEGPYAHNFIVRFRGLTDGGSDKVPAIPAPGAAATLAAAGLLLARRRR